MPTAIHSFSQEEMMAYLDGELSVDRALAAAQHLEQCRDCQRLAADFQNVSRRLLDWDIDPIASAPPQIEISKKPPLVFWKRPWVLGACAVAMLVVVVAVLRRSTLEYDRMPVNTGALYERMQAPAVGERITTAQSEAAPMGVVGGTGVIGGVLGGVPGRTAGGSRTCCACETLRSTDCPNCAANRDDEELRRKPGRAGANCPESPGLHLSTPVEHAQRGGPCADGHAPSAYCRAGSNASGSKAFRARG